MPYDVMDPLSVFPVEVAIKILENIELEELLLSTRFTSRAWNDILFSQLSHLIVASYQLRLDLGGRRFDLALKFRNRNGTLDVYAADVLSIHAFCAKDGACLPISAGVVNRSVSRSFMSNRAIPLLSVARTSEDRLVQRAELEKVQYSNPVTNTGALDSIALNLTVESFLDDGIVSDSETDSESSDEQEVAVAYKDPTIRVALSIAPAELTKWIVLCRLAQGYQTPAEARELSNPANKLNGVVGPYRGFKNSAGIWCFPQATKVTV